MDEFIIDRSKVPIVDQLKKTVKDRFNVDIGYSDTVKDDGTEKQWIALHGDEEAQKTEAREYLKTICNADEHITMQFPEGLHDILSKPSEYRKIEEQSGAVIMFYQTGEVDIFGSDIAVTLAMSAIEEKVSQYETDPSSLDTSSVDLKKHSDLRLDTQLKLACEKHDMSYEDYSHTPTSVKRTLLSWLSNDMDQVVDDGESNTDQQASASDSCMIIDDSVEIIEHPTRKSSDKTPKVKLYFVDPKLQVPSSAAASISPVGEMTDVFRKTLFPDVSGNSQEDDDTLDLEASPRSSLPKYGVQNEDNDLVLLGDVSSIIQGEKDSPSLQTVRQFALNRGYSNREVDTVLSEDPNIKHSTLLTRLHENRSKDLEKMSVECSSPSTSTDKPLDFITVDAVDASAVDSPSTAGGAAAKSDSVQDCSWTVKEDYDKSVLKYFHQLSKDFTDETPNLSREELLRNNQERQKILKAAYEESMRIQSSVPEKNDEVKDKGKGNNVRSTTPKNRKRNKKKKKKKKGKTAATSTNTQTNPPGEPIAGPSNEIEKETIDESSSEEDENQSDDDDVIIENDEVQFISENKTSNIRPGGVYTRSPRPQSPQNPKKARQEERNTPDMLENAPLDFQGISNAVQSTPIPRHFQDARNQNRMDTASSSSTGYAGGARPRYPSGERQPYPRQRKNKWDMPPVQHYQTSRPPQNYNPKGTFPGSAYSLQTGQRVPARRPCPKRGSELRPIVIDGSNVAVTHGNTTHFSSRGIKLAVDFFLERGHKQVTAFVPNWRRGGTNAIKPTRDPEILETLEKAGYLSFTPSRYLNKKKIVPYDDRFIVELAAKTDGVIISNDNYRDLVNVKKEWRTVIEQRLLMYTFAGDFFMVPDDPFGRSGPTLEQLLRKPAVIDCENCDNMGPSTSTGGPRQVPMGVPQLPAPNVPRPLPQPRQQFGGPPGQQPQQFGGPPRQQPQQFGGPPRPQPQQFGGPPRQQFVGPPRQQPQQFGGPQQQVPQPQPLPRPPYLTEDLATQLMTIFPEQNDMVIRILANHPCESDMNKLSAYILDAMT